MHFQFQENSFDSFALDLVIKLSDEQCEKLKAHMLSGALGDMPFDTIEEDDWIFVSSAWAGLYFEVSARKLMITMEKRHQDEFEALDYTSASNVGASEMWMRYLPITQQIVDAVR